MKCRACGKDNLTELGVHTGTGKCWDCYAKLAPPPPPMRNPSRKLFVEVYIAACGISMVVGAAWTYLLVKGCP